MLDALSDSTTFSAQAGTPAFAEAIALGSACDYLQRLGMDAIARRASDGIALHSPAQKMQIRYDKMYAPDNILVLG